MAAGAGSAHIRVLLVEDDLDDALGAQLGLNPRAGFVVTHVRTAAEALRAVQRSPFDVCLLDYRLPDASGIALCRQLRHSGSRAPILLVSSVRDDGAAARAFEAGADDYLVKSPTFGNRLADEVRARVRPPK